VHEGALQEGLHWPQDGTVLHGIGLQLGVQPEADPELVQGLQEALQYPVGPGVGGG